MANLFYATDPRTGLAWSDKTQVYTPEGGGDLAVASGTYQFTVNPTITDAVRFCKVPANATVIGGCITGADLDTGAGTMALNFGWEANGAEGANPTGFGGGALSGTAVADLLFAAGIWRPLQGILLTAGTQRFTYETWIVGVVTAPAAAGGTGKLSMIVQYLCP